MRSIFFCISALTVVILSWGGVTAQDNATLRDTLSRKTWKLTFVMAQDGVTLSGVVEDQTEAVIPEAKLTLTNKATGETRETKADGAGRLSFSNVPSGEYSLKAEAKNFEVVELPITVGAAPPPAIKVKMKTSIKEAVTVTATIDRRSNPLAPENNADAARFDDKLLSDVPTQGRNILPIITDFLSQAAQGAEGPSVVVDGVEANRLSVPTSSIKRVSINKNAYSAEYRRPGKARIEVITEDGSDRHIHGGVSVFARNSALDARNAFARVKPDSDSQLYEARFSGPLPSKRGTFFLSGERNLNDEGVVVNARTLAGPFVNNVLAGRRNTDLLGRVDLPLSKVNMLNAVYTFNDETGRNRGVGGFRLPEQAISAAEREHRFQLSERAFFSNSFINDLRFFFKRENERVGGLAAGPAIVVAGAFTGGPSQTFRADRETTLDLQEIASYFRGKHELRFGAELRQNFIRATEASNFGGVFEFSSLDNFARGTPFVFRVNQGRPDVSFSQREVYGFFQDDVRLRPSFNLTLGLRYGWQTNLDDLDNFAPRLAFAFAPGKQKTVLRGGAGVFYERLRETITQQALLFDGARIRELVIPSPSFPDPFGTSGASQTLPSIVRVAPEIDAPYLTQASLSVERKLVSGMQLTVDYLTLRGTHLLRSRNINAPLPATGLRSDPNFLNINQVESSAVTRSNALSVTLQGRIGARLFKGIAQYTLSRTTDDTGGAFALPANNFDLRPEMGRADFDQRHRFNFSGRLRVPLDFTLGARLALTSGAPFNITTGFDDNRDTVANDRPSGVTRNTGQGPEFAQLDLRLTRRIRGIPTPFKNRHGSGDSAGPGDLLISADAFNALNRANLNRIVGEQSSTFFGRANSSLPARTLQLSIKYSF
jgi:carboxypeptidase family protein